MTESKRRRLLTEIYAQVPDAGCKGLCDDHCSTIGVFDVERRVLEQAAGRPLGGEPASDAPLTILGARTACPLLVAGRCSTYTSRPLICRVFGAAEGLPCPHGCKPDKVISDVAVFDLMRRVEAL